MMSTRTTQTAEATRSRGSTALIATAMALAITFGTPVANLMSKVHLSHGDAIAVLGLLTGSGGALLYAFYPQLIILLGTLRLLLATAGSGAVIGF
jgi:hypothetical protein